LILAIDHRANLLAELNKYAPQPLSDDDFTAFKRAVMRVLVPLCSGVLVDPAHGIGYGIAEGTIQGGLLAPLEVTNYDVHPRERDVQFIPNWSVEKIKRVGGDGVKLLLPFHPEADNTPDKLAVVRRLVDDWAQQDIPFFLEPVAYSPDPERRLTNAELRQIAVWMAEEFSRMGVDVLKLQFPVDAKQSRDRDEWRAACVALDAACSVPWTLLSGGVDYDTFEEQARIACEAGASGIIVGRAVGADAVRLHGGERTTFLQEIAAQRLKALAGICAEAARSWREKRAGPQASLTWYVE